MIKKRKRAIRMSRMTIVTVKMSFDCKIEIVVLTGVLLDAVDEAGGFCGVSGANDGDCD